MNEKEREKALADFEANRFNILITVDALNAGLNVPEVDSAICVSGVSTELVATQQAGQYSAHTH
jgi:superfamily II DNA or RNA helicase